MSDSNAAWFYTSNGQQAGPVSADALRQFAAVGRVRASDLVWSEGMASWTPAGQVPGLLPAMPAGAIAPPPLPARPLGYHVPPPPPPGSGDPAMRWLLPVDRSGWAIAAGYFGLFSILIVPAPIAIVVSLIAIRDIRKHPERHGMGRALFGLIAGALFTLVPVVMFINAAIR
jgi:hypothetical protein